MATITTSIIPFSSNDLNRPGAGAEDWNGQDYADIPAQGNRQQRLDYYFRFSWTHFEGATQGSYNWAKFDSEIQKAISKKQKFSFGIMTMMPPTIDGFNGPVTYDNAQSLYPLYLHNLMQSEGVKDWRTTGNWGGNDYVWVPNWNSNNYLGRMEALLTALAAHINTTSFNGIPYKNVIGYIDIRFMGSYGEWHHAGIVDPVTSYPSGMKPTVATYKRIIDAHIQAFQDFQLVILFAAYDAMFFNNTQVPNEVTYYALTAKNRRGLIGYRRDQWGSSQWNDAGNYVHAYIEKNTRSYNGVVFNTLTTERWKSAPVVGEPENNGENLPTLVTQIQQYHANSIGNGNYSISTSADSNMRLASKTAGYRLQIEGGQYTNTDTSVNVTLNWRNAGIAPTYEDWNVILYLKNSVGATVAQITSVFKPRLFLPAGAPSAFTDTFSIGVPAGTYTLAVKVVDPNGYRSPMPLFISGVQSDGGYNLGTLTIGTSNTTTTTTTTSIPITTTTTTQTSTTTTTTTTKIPLTTTTTTTKIPITTTTTTTIVPPKTIVSVTIRYSDGTILITP